MLRVLVKKQLTEVFRSYFFNPKKNQMRSKGAILLLFLLFFLLLAGVLGGMFTFLALSLCPGLEAAGMGWLYFLLLSLLAIAFGTFGSVFNTFSGLYLPKDNDLLLSMPIPVRTIILSRLINVYLLGTMYSAAVLLPMMIVWWVTAGATVSNVICCVLLFFIVTFLVLILSCLLGWVVAKVSLKLRNKSCITVLISLLLIGLYYFVYFRAADLIRDLVENAGRYGEKIRASAYLLYRFGTIGEGNLPAALITAAATALVFVLVMLLLSKGFVKIAVSKGTVSKARYRERKTRAKSVFGALLSKELRRFTSSPVYMLNCGLGVLILPALGVLLLIRGREILTLLDAAVPGYPGFSVFILSAAMILVSTLNIIAAPSVSLEGKSIWIPQSLPVEPKTVLLSKCAVHLILTGVPMLFVCVCAQIAVSADAAGRLALFFLPLIFTAFMALFCTFLGVRHARLNWTSEMMPVKQGAAVMIALFGGWGISALYAVPFLLAGYRLGAPAYLALWCAVYLILSLLLLHWLGRRGAETFSRL